MKTQSGRSMIEMLGVLAIIGVLSVGGLAGYTRAMRANRVNNALDYMGRCFVETRGRGDGITAVAASPCNTILNEALPNGVNAANCQRSAGGATTCAITVGTADLASAFAAKIGSASVPSNKQFDYAAGAWVASTATVTTTD